MRPVYGSCLVVIAAFSVACGDDGGDSVLVPNPLTNPDDGPPAGNQNQEATCDVPAEAGLEDVSNPTTVVGDGTAESCTSDAFVEAVAKGGVITFDCGPDDVIITLDRTAKVFNDTGPVIVIDGGGKVTLSGAGNHRILYMNTCDEAQRWTTSHCDNQDHPRLSVQNITLIDASSKREEEYRGGGAIWARGGRLKIINTRFFNNVTEEEGITVGGGAVRALSQFEGRPVYLVNTTFGGGEGLGNRASNGGAISSIGVSWTILNSMFTHNDGVDVATPSGSEGGGKGGAIFNDGNTMTLDICGTRIQHNEANVHGSAIFFVTNDHSGNIVIDRSVITDNVGGSWYPTYPQISGHDDTPIDVTDSVIE